MDRGAWWAIIYGGHRLDMTEQLTHTHTKYLLAMFTLVREGKMSLKAQLYSSNLK